MLDKDRAQEIADYIDTGLGTIPSSIVLSAQPEAELKVIGRGKTIEFNVTQKSFLVLDGQHRVYGFSLAKKDLRVPVVIYNGLSRQDESRLFIDINTKQRPVPNELLLDIKRLAEYESNEETQLGAVFDLFAENVDSPLLGLLSPSTRTKGKLSRVTFYSALRPFIDMFENHERVYIYSALASYLRAFIDSATERGMQTNITNPTVFRAVTGLFPEVARRVKDRFAGEYNHANFSEVMRPMFQGMKSTTLKKPGQSHRILTETLMKSLRAGFTL